MRFVKMLKPATLLVMMMAIVPMLMPAGASAEPTTIYAEMGTCTGNVDGYRVQLQSGDQNAPASAFPASVTLTFEDGSTLEATSTFGPSVGTNTYRVDGATGLVLVSATAEFDAETYKTYRFSVTARPEPCFPEAPVTHSVSGNIVQQGNQRAVADLTVCLVEADLCTTTDASGSFVIAGVEDGTYTLYTDGNNWKEQYNTVTVSGSDVYVDIVQQKGGGN